MTDQLITELIAAMVAARRPKATKLGAHPALCQRVIADLERLWSPQQIAARLAGDFGDDESMRISHETIYKSLYLQGRGELRRELARTREEAVEAVQRIHRQYRRDLVPVKNSPVRFRSSR